MTCAATPLDAHMRESKLTDAELARRVGVSRPHITKIRNGKRSPSLGVAVRIAEVTRLPVASLAGQA